MSNTAQAIVFDNDWHYTMALFPASLLKTTRRFTACATTMRVRFVCGRIHHATIMVEIRHSLATLNANNFVVYGQNIKCGGTRFLI